MSQPSAIALWAEYSKPARVRNAPRENIALRRLFWLYFWLLIGEGILRKWVLPGLAQPLLLIRDPIPLAVMWIGFRNRVIPRTIGVYLWAMLAIACVAVSFYQIPYAPITTIYGFRCDFLHLPMLLIAPIILDQDDFRKLCVAILWVSIPTALLMVYQFESPPTAWINSGLDGTFKQITATATHIRPPGPFSFVVGPYCLYSLCTAILFGFAIDRDRSISKKFLLLSAAALIIATAVSSSRTLLGGIAVVIFTGLAGALAINPRIFGRVLSLIVGLAAFAAILTTTSTLKEGTQAFSERVVSASASEGGTSGFIDRIIGDYVSVVPAIERSTIGGAGLGVGTAGGSMLMTGKVQFLIAESEWPRVVGESGPILGCLYILFRLALATWLFWRSIQALRRGKTLPICLFGACALSIISGEFSQGTIVGFAMLTAGMCLTSAKLACEPVEVVDAEVVDDAAPVQPGLVRR